MKVYISESRFILSNHTNYDIHRTDRAETLDDDLRAFLCVLRAYFGKYSYLS
jgi:hypothetical protein